MIIKRPFTSVAVFFAVLAAVAAVAVVATRPSGMGGEASAATARDDIELTFRTVNADKELRGPGEGAMANRPVVVRDVATGDQIASGSSTADGTVTLTGIDDALTISVTATAPSGYVTFPVVKDVSAIGQGEVVDIPLYKNSQQWLSWGKTSDRRRVGSDAGKPTGAPLWTIDPQNNMEFPPSVAYGVVVYGSYHGFLCANDQATGKLLWQEYIGDYLADPPFYGKFASQVAVSTWKKDGEQRAFVYYTNLNGMVGCRDLFTGEKIWQMRKAKGNGTGGKTLWFKSVEASPLVVGETVYFCSRYNRSGYQAGLWALDRRTGKVRWFRRLARKSISKIGSSPVYRSGRIFVATYDGDVCAVSRYTGKILWRKRLGGQFYSTPAVYGSRLFIGNKSNGRVYCLKTTNGRVLWRTRRLGISVHGSPAVYGGKVFVGAGKRFYALNMTNGRVSWSRPTKNRVWGSPSVLNGVVYYSCRGRTYARKTRNGYGITLPDSVKYVGRYCPVTANRHLIIVNGRQKFSAYLPAN